MFSLHFSKTRNWLYLLECPKSYTALSNNNNFFKVGHNFLPENQKLKIFVSFLTLNKPFKVFEEITKENFQQQDEVKKENFTFFTLH